MIYFYRTSKPCTNKNQLNNLKINKEKIFKGNTDIVKNDVPENLQSKIPIKSNLEATLSFLSSLSCKYFLKIYILHFNYA